jgi:hypothetical protein
MWGVSYKTIARLLTLKSANLRGIQEGAGPLYKRTEAAVGKKLRRIRDERPELWIEQEGKWDWEAVSRYLHESQIDQALLDRLLILTDDDIETINQVCPFSTPKVSQLIDQDRPREPIICSLMLICQRRMTSRDSTAAQEEIVLGPGGLRKSEKEKHDWLGNGGNI